MTTLDVALEYAQLGWRIFPLNGKVPAIRGGRGLHDATTNADTIVAWWTRWPAANIGAPVAESWFVLDIDVYHQGDVTLRQLEHQLGPLPITLTAFSGRGDGSRHLYFERPPALGRGRLGDGIDVRLPGRHYLVMPPSVHPDTGGLYRWERPFARPAPLPDSWCAALAPPAPAPVPKRPLRADGPRPGDQLNATVTWAEILTPHGWTHYRDHGDTSYWTRPGKTYGISASTNALGTDRLHVFTSAAPPLEADESYSKFGAYAVLEHDGDHLAAARALRTAS